MRQERGDRVLDLGSQGACIGATVCQCLFTIVEQNLAEIRICANQGKLPRALVERDPIGFRTEDNLASEIFAEFRHVLSRKLMNKMNGSRREFGPCEGPKVANDAPLPEIPSAADRNVGPPQRTLIRLQGCRTRRRISR